MPSAEVMELLQEVEQEAFDAQKQPVGKLDKQDWRLH